MQKLIQSLLRAAGLLCLVTSTAFAAQVLGPNSNEDDLVPTGKGWGERAYPAPPRADPNGNASGKAGPNNNGIYYHGGPLILGGTNVYYIWYGNWSGNTADSILTNLAASIGGSPYFNINTTYYNGSNTHVTNIVNYSGSTTDNYSHGTALSDAQIQAVVANAIGPGKLPSDTKGVYFVLTSADVTATSGFCTQYCGWHTHGTISGSDIKYSFVGNPDRCPSACEWQTTSPNGNAGADGMASIIAHELEEATTDPDLNAWYDRRGYENADKCAWTFSPTSTLPNGALYNVTLGGSKYLIQRNWVNASGGYCSMSY
jgi:Phosphate-induced protein 1 conserved region